MLLNIVIKADAISHLFVNQFSLFTFCVGVLHFARIFYKIKNIYPHAWRTGHMFTFCIFKNYYHYVVNIWLKNNFPTTRAFPDTCICWLLTFEYEIDIHRNITIYVYMYWTHNWLYLLMNALIVWMLHVRDEC